MKLEPTRIDGLYIVNQNFSSDTRGAFVKNFAYSEFSRFNLECDFKETYYTYSYKNVIRGMHFQIPPFDHSKLVSVISGTILDVVLDLRSDSETYGQYFTAELSRENGKSLYIPKGFAHGFSVLSESAIAYYQVTSEYSADHDMGIHYDSFGFEWPVFNPVTSDRDKKFGSFSSFKSPF